MGGDARRNGEAIDWAAARERLERADRVVSGDLESTPAERRRILEARARSLARPLESAPTGATLELLEFKVGGERYGVESRYVFGTVRLEHLSLLPGAEAPVAGLTAWRGELLTLFDLRILTGAAAGGLSDLGWIVVLGETVPAFGVLADRFGTVSTYPLTAIKPLGEGLSTTRNYVRGVTDEAVLVLDAPELIRIYS